MEAMDAILSRRSIRVYGPESVPDELVKQLLKAAMSAPSGGNEQPWHFVVVNSRKTLEDIAAVHPNAQMLSGAPMAILVCGEERREKYKGLWVQDCAAATENILIAAQALGLGCVWVGVYPVRERVNALRILLGIPAEVAPFSLVVVGYPAELKPPVDRFDQARIHHNRWDLSSISGLEGVSSFFWMKMKIRRMIRSLLFSVLTLSY